MTANPMPPMIPMSGQTAATSAQGSGRFKPVDPLRVLRKYVTWLVLSAVVGAILGVVTWGVLLLTFPRYTSSVQLNVGLQPGNIEDMNPTGYGINSDYIDRTIRNEVTRLLSEQTLQEALRRPEVQATRWYQSLGNIQDAQEDLEDYVLSVYPLNETTLINVSASINNEDDPPVIVDAILNVYLLQLNTEAGTSTSERRAALTNERRLLDSDIARLKQQQTTFTSENQLSALDARMADAQRLLEYYTQNMAELELQLSSSIEMHNVLVQRQQMGQTDPSPDDIAMVNNLPEVSQVQMRLDQYRENQRAAVATFGQNSYQATRAQYYIDACEQELEQKRQNKLRELQASRIEQYASAISSLKGSIDTLRQEMDAKKVTLTDLNQKLTRFAQIEEELTMKNDRLKQLDSMLGDLRVWTELPEAQRVKRLTRTTKPELTFPKPELVIPAVSFFMLALTTGIIFLLEMLDQRVKAPSDVKLIADAELLGVLPDAAEDLSAPTGIERVVEKYPAGLMAESFRNVRTSLMSKMDRHGYKTLMLVGAQPSGGTSCVLHNLAVSLAFHGRSVVIVDANMRRPAQHKLFDLDNDSGLVDVLRGRRSIEQCLQKIDGLSVSLLTTGQAADAPPELLEGSAFRSIIHELESKFDTVLIDAPPALLSSESQMLAKHADAVAFVVRAISDTRGMIERMTRRFDGQRAEVLGIILNGVQSAAGGYFRKSYREFYRYRDNGSAPAGSNGRHQTPERAATN
ncbi:MAG: polysaccharide biosynthesis tyrosine autokinase [Phycisphaeraceae bacterium]|nr:polysaccharide biosynthesis tyrosine autokinase [Phycisphaeraceae bacterium]